MQLANPSVDDAASVTFPNEQKPDTITECWVPVCPILNVVAVVEASVVAPVTSNVLCVEIAPAAVVVAFPPTHKAPAMETWLVVEAFAKLERPVTASVPPVSTLVLMVVAACASATTKNIATATPAARGRGPDRAKENILLIFCV